MSRIYVDEMPKCVDDCPFASENIITQTALYSSIKIQGVYF